MEAPVNDRPSGEPFSSRDIDVPVPSNTRRYSLPRNSGYNAWKMYCPSSKVANQSPTPSDFLTQHSVQFMTLLPHQEKVLCLRLFQQKTSNPSNLIAHLEHRTKSHVSMEAVGFDSPVCRIRISAMEKRNIERVLELLDEYCPVLLKYSNHRELTKVRESLLHDDTTNPLISKRDLRTLIPELLPKPRRLPSARKKESNIERKKHPRKNRRQASKAETPVRDNSDSKRLGGKEKGRKRKKIKDVPSEEKKDNEKDFMNEKKEDVSQDAPPKEKEEKSTEDSSPAVTTNHNISNIENESEDNPTLPSNGAEKTNHNDQSLRKSPTPTDTSRALEKEIEDYWEKMKQNSKTDGARQLQSRTRVLEKYRAMVNGKPIPKAKPFQMDADSWRGEERTEKGVGDSKAMRYRSRRRKGPFDGAQHSKFSSPGVNDIITKAATIHHRK